MSANSVRIAAIALAVATATAHWLPAQEPKSTKSVMAPGNSTKSGAAAAKSGAATTSGADLKQQILSSPEWKQIDKEYQSWLNSQVIYTPADIQRINANLAAQIQAMPAEDMQGFVNDWKAKLKVLNDKNFQDAQQWLGSYLSVLTDGYRRQRLQQLGLTDVANMSAAQLDDAITRIRAEQISTQQSQQAYSQSQQLTTQAIQQRSATQQAIQQAGSPGPSQFGTNLPPPQKPKFAAPPDAQLPMYVDGYGRIGYLLPF